MAKIVGDGQRLTDGIGRAEGVGKGRGDAGDRAVARSHHCQRVAQAVVSERIRGRGSRPAPRRKAVTGLRLGHGFEQSAVRGAAAGAIVIGVGRGRFIVGSRADHVAFLNFHEFAQNRGIRLGAAVDRVARHRPRKGPCVIGNDPARARHPVQVAELVPNVECRVAVGVRYRRRPVRVVRVGVSCRRESGAVTVRAARAAHVAVVGRAVGVSRRPAVADRHGRRVRAAGR